MREELTWREYCVNDRALVPGNAAALLTRGEEAFGAVLEAIASARRSVLLEFYAFSDDSVGRLFAAALREKAAQGVPVYLLYDAVGSVLTSRAFMEELAAGGVRVAEYRPVVLWKPYRNWIRRNHRKLVCLDGTRAFVGGFNITANDAPRSLGGRGWKDMTVSVRGPAVAALERLFWEDWREGAGEGGRRWDPLPPAAPAPAGSKYVSVVASPGIRNLYSIRRAYCYAIDRAERSIRITNAYFLPDWTIYSKLAKAARRGVRVEIITPGETDHPYVRWASWSRFKYLLRCGVKLYEWRGPILHAKAAVIDGQWCSVGSLNLDHRSLHYNLEVNLNVHDRDFCAALSRAFDEDLRRCAEITPAVVRSLPLLSRAVSRLLYYFRTWL